MITAESIADLEQIAPTDEEGRCSWCILAVAPVIVKDGISFRMDEARMQELVEAFEYFQAAGWEPAISPAPHEDTGRHLGFHKRLAVWRRHPDRKVRLCAYIHWTREGWQALKHQEIRYHSLAIRPRPDGKGGERVALVETSTTIIPLQTDVGDFQTLPRVAGIQIEASVSTCPQTEDDDPMKTKIPTTPNSIAAMDTPGEGGGEGGSPEGGKAYVTREELAKLLAEHAEKTQEGMSAMGQRLDAMYEKMTAAEGEDEEEEKEGEDEGKEVDASAKKIADLERENRVLKASAALAGLGDVQASAADLVKAAELVASGDVEGFTALAASLGKAPAMKGSKSEPKPAETPPGPGASIGGNSLRVQASTGSQEPSGGNQDLDLDAIYNEATKIAASTGEVHADVYGRLLEGTAG